MGEFNRSRNRKDGIDSQCRDCRAEYRRARRAAKPKPPELPAGMKRCPACGETKGVGEFGKNQSTKDGLQAWCRDCQAKYYKANREAILAYQRRYQEDHEIMYRQRYHRIHTKVLNLYGGMCAECGSPDRLELDHINNDGAQDRINLFGDPRAGGQSFYLYLLKLGHRRKDLQILCHPCHRIKTTAELKQKKGELN